MILCLNLKLVIILLYSYANSKLAYLMKLMAEREFYLFIYSSVFIYFYVTALLAN